MGVKGPWIETYTHKQFSLLYPDPDSVCIEDIAYQLAKTCRWVGACQRFYSVAEHSIIMARLASQRAKLTCLFHDAHEAYLGDPSRPLKMALAEGAGKITYQTLATRIDKVIQEALGFEFRKLAEVKHWDNEMLRIEALEVMGSTIIGKYKIPKVPEFYEITPSVFQSLTIEFRGVKDYIEYTATNFINLFAKYMEEEVEYEAQRM